MGVPPNHPLFNRIFHDINPPAIGIPTWLRKPPYSFIHDIPIISPLNHSFMMDSHARWTTIPHKHVRPRPPAPQAARYEAKKMASAWAPRSVFLAQRLSFFWENMRLSNPNH